MMSRASSKNTATAATADSTPPVCLPEEKILPRWKRIGATIMVAWTLASPSGLVWAQTSADTQNPAMRPTVTTTSTGIPLVNIAAPNAAGVSANRYTSFNVDSIGLILNNSTQTGSTALGGQIGANPNFNGRTAKVILNEVVTALPSQLNGPLAIYGDQAKIIIANPNGITCNGCSFLNTSHVALTTGTSHWLDAYGKDTDFSNATTLALDVQGGRILITGQGLSSPLQNLDLIAQTLKLDGATNVGTGTLNLLAGRQRIDSETLARLASLSGNTRTDIGEEFAIDASVLGAMTAGSIQIVSTAKGMGVRSSPVLAASSGDLKISADGQITVTSAQASGNVVLTSQSDKITAGLVYAQHNLSMSAQSIDNRGQTILAEGDAQITAPTLDNADGKIIAGGALTLATPGTRFDLGNGSIEGLGSLSVQAASITNSGSFQHAAQLNLQADDGISNTGSLIGGGDLTLQAGGAITNNGTLGSNGALGLTGSSITNTGTLEGVGTTTLQTTGLLNNSGNVIAHSDLVVGAGQLQNAELAYLQSAGAARVAITGDAVNSGTLQSKGQLELSANSLTNTNTGSVLADQASDAPITDLSTLKIGQALVNQGGIGSNGAMTISADALTNSSAIETQGALTLQAASTTNAAGATIIARTDLKADLGTFSNAGSLQADENANISMNAASDNTSGKMVAGQDLSLTTQKTSAIGGQVGAQGNLTLNLGDYTHNDGETDFAAGQSLTINATSLTNNGVLEAPTNLNLYLTGNLTNNGLLLASNDINLKGADIVNYASTIEAGGNLTVTANSFANKRGPLATKTTNYGDDAPADAVNCKHDHGYCEGTAQVETTPAAVLSAGKNLTVNATGAVINDASIITAGGDIKVVAGSVENTPHILTTDWHGHWKEWKGALSGWKDHDDYGTSVTGNSAAAIQATGAADVRAPNGTVNNKGNIDGSTVYLGGKDVQNGITAYQYQTPPTTVPDSSIDLTLGFDKPGATKLPAGVKFTPGSSTLFTSSSRLALAIPGGSVLNAALPEALRNSDAAYLLDGYLENQALRQAALDQTGKASFLGLADPTQEREALYQNAVEFASQYGIRLGTALTDTQQALLTKPILWYVEETVTGPDGKSYTALVPRVYLPQNYVAALAKQAGGQITGNTITLVAENTVHNTGFIQASGDLNITAAQFINEKRSADIGEIHQWVGKNGYMKLTGDKVQPGGFVSAANINLNADQVKSISGEFYQDGKEISPQLAAALGSKYSYTENQDHISQEWVQVSKSSSVALIVTIVVTVVLSCVTAGAAAAVIGTTLLGSTALASAAAAVASSVIVGTATQLATTGKVAWDSIGKGAAVAALTAGALSYMSSASGAAGEAAGNTAKTASTSWTESAKAAITKNFTVQGLEKAVERSAVSAGIQTSINGGSFGSAFKSSMVSEFAAAGANAIGDIYAPAPGVSVLGGEGGIAHAVTHAAFAAGVAKISDKDVEGAAIGAAASALAGNWVASVTGDGSNVDANGNGLNLSQEELANQKRWFVGIEGAIGGVSSILAGRDGSAGRSAAENTAQNNYLNHGNAVLRASLQDKCNSRSGCSAEDRAKLAKLNAVDAETTAAYKAACKTAGDACNAATDKLDAAIASYQTGDPQPNSKLSLAGNVSVENSRNQAVGLENEPGIAQKTLGHAVTDMVETEGTSLLAGWALGKIASRVVSGLRSLVGADAEAALPVSRPSEANAPNFTTEGKGGIPLSSTIQRDTTVVLSEDVTLNNGQILPKGSTVTVSDNTMKVTTSDGQSTLMNYDKVTSGVKALPAPTEATGSATLSGRSVGDLADAAAEIDRGDLTLAGRALQKHGNREGSAFPRAQGNPAAVNEQAKSVVDEILNNPATTVTQRTAGRFGTVTDVVAPDGRGLRYDANGKFIGFLEPPKK